VDSPLGRCALVRQKDHPRRILSGFRKTNTGGPALCPQKLIGNLNQQSGAVARRLVAADRPAVLEVDQNVHRVGHDPMPRNGVEASDKADTAGTAFKRSIVQRPPRRPVHGRALRLWLVATHADHLIPDQVDRTHATLA